VSAALEGDLARFQPAELLQLLQLAQATGRLELARAAAPPGSPGGAPETVDVFFVSGRPVFARTDGHAVRTGELLVHHGHASPAAVAQARREPAASRSSAATSPRRPPWTASAAT